MKADRQTVLGGQVQGEAACLRSPHHGSKVDLREHALKGDRLWLVPLKQFLDAASDREQPLLQDLIRRRSNDRDLDQCGGTIRRDVDNADPAPGEPGSTPSTRIIAEATLRPGWPRRRRERRSCRKCSGRRCCL